MRNKKCNQTNRQTDNFVQDVKIKTYILYLNKNIVQILFYLYTKNQKYYTYDWLSSLLTEDVKQSSIDFFFFFLKKFYNSYFEFYKELR